MFSPGFLINQEINMSGHTPSPDQVAASADAALRDKPTPIGLLAFRHWNKKLPLQVLYCPSGYYIGTVDIDGTPQSRESIQHWPDRDTAVKALESGMWTQKMVP